MARYTASFAHVFDGKAFKAVKDKIKARENEASEALAAAINSAAENTVKLSIKEWNTNLKIREDYANGKIRVARKASARRPEALVTARSRATRADNFKYRVAQNRKGVHLNVRRGGTGGIIKNAFVIPRAKSNGKPLILERLEKYQKGESRDFKHGGKTVNRWGKAAKPRFKALYGPSINQHFHDSRNRVAPQAMSEARQQFIRAMQS